LNIPSLVGRQVKLAVRTEADPRALASAVRAEIARIDRQLAIESIATMVDRLGEVVAPRRFSVMPAGCRPIEHHASIRHRYGGRNESVTGWVRYG
jgi:hypothetical protein